MASNIGVDYQNWKTEPDDRRTPQIPYTDDRRTPQLSYTEDRRTPHIPYTDDRRTPHIPYTDDRRTPQLSYTEDRRTPHPPPLIAYTEDRRTPHNSIYSGQQVFKHFSILAFYYKISPSNLFWTEGQKSYFSIVFRHFYF